MPPLSRAKNAFAAFFSKRYLRVILIAAVSIRLAFILFFGASVSGSGRRYVDPASNFISGHWAAPSTIDQLPGAPLFFVPFFVLFGERYGPVVFAQHLLGLASLFLLLSAAKRAWGDRAAAFAGLLLVCQFIIPYQECFLLSETVGQFWFCLALYLAVELRHREAGPRYWAFGGLAAGMAAMTRGEYVLFAPMAAAFLSLPGKAPRRRPLAYLAVWALLIGGWTLRNSFLGFNDFNPHGPTVLLDTALPLVRYDLPTEPVAKRLLKEQTEICAIKHCDPRPTALLRLEREQGYSYLDARKAVGRVAREAVLTQPMKFLPMVWQNFLTFFRPIAWVTDEGYDQRSPIRDSLSEHPALAPFWKVLEAGPQYAGWAVVALAFVSPLFIFLTAGSRRWSAAVVLAGAANVAATASMFRAVARTQADLYLPLGLLGGFVLDGALAWLAESSKD